MGHLRNLDLSDLFLNTYHFYTKDLLIAEMSKLEITDINQALPTEIFRNILQRLDIPSLCVARQTCKRWKEIIDGFELVEEACSKYFLCFFET